MRRRWYYWKRMLRANRPLLLLVAGVIAVFLFLGGKRWELADVMWTVFEDYGVQAAGFIMEEWFPVIDEEENGARKITGKTTLLTYLEELAGQDEYSEDPAYERMLAAEWENRDSMSWDSESSERMGEDEKKRESEGDSGTADSASPVAEAITIKPSGSVVIREKLADFDYMMKNFYSVHPTTTADRDLIDAEKFLTMDLQIEKDSEKPQILIYHTHSQEEFADYPENPEATIVGVGARLAKLLEARGYQVIHDTTVYDYRDGKLDRSQAYTYALDGITSILQKNPSIEVVLDIHRDGVAEGTKLVTEINGKQTAQIMLFNGTSQTPDGPIEYLPNPNREANMAFSFQMQLKAVEQYPGFTRKIYLKGLRYNQHVRARTALVEVGAQTNTYAEALNAMEPFADIISQVLEGD